MKTILATLLLALALTGCSQSADVPETTVGVYSNENFEATVTDDTIDVYIVDGNDSYLYWRGTWEDDKATVVSDGDRKTLDSSIMGSGSDDKEFEIDGDSISFDFQALGSRSTETLKKD